MNKKVLAFVICALILFSILTSGCITEEKDKDNEPEDPVVLKDAPTKLNETDQNQEIAIIEHNSEDKFTWYDWRFQISKDGNIYYRIVFNTTEPNLKIICEKENIGDDVYWDEGEKIWFYEDGANYEPGTYFYCKMVHMSSKGPYFDLFVKVY